jgi:hypothetical protein
MPADPHRLSSTTGSGTPLVSLRVLAFNFVSVGAVAPKKGVEFPGSLSCGTTALTVEIGLATGFVAFLGLKSVRGQSLDGYGEGN